MNRGAIILCGGASARMGRDKAMLAFGPDEVLLQRVVRLVGEVVPHDRIVCVAAAEQSLPPLPAGVHVLRDVQPHCGPLAGLATGLATLRDRVDTAFACGCDTPLLLPGFIARMFERLADHQVAAPHDGERFHPLTAVYCTDVLPIAESLLAVGERSLQTLLERCDLCRVPIDDLRDVDPELASLRGCNSPEEYRLLLKQIGVESE
jgi:molybdopterin-guanine dinucleotide biosynthesis protein A